jgi:site-specific recombinase XerD
MSISMRARAGDYLEMRRSLGCKLRGEGRMLAGFATRCDEQGQATITISAALAWATESRDAAPAHWRRRLSVVRGFARYLATVDPACQIPPADLLPAPSRRPPPYIYSAEEIAALIHAAETIGAPLPAATMQALISLIAATGLRVGEALALDRGDAGPDSGTLTVTGKNDQMRLVPLHATTAAMLAGYAARRDRLCPHPASPALFITSTGQRAAQRGVAETFARLVTLAGIATPPGRRRPRVHDLRHTFAVTTLTRWYREGADVQARLPMLSAYLGHSCPEATYWYLQATPELLSLAAGRLPAPGQHDATGGRTP